MKNLTKRVLMALWGIPLILFLSYKGGMFFLLLILVINAMALWEFYSIYGERNYHAYRKMALIFSTIFILASFRLPYDLIFTLFLVIMLLIFLRHLKISEPLSTINTAITINGLIYISLFLVILLILRLNFENWIGISVSSNVGGRFFVLLWAGIWLCDTAAYFGGRLLGKHKLSPRTSPNKTVEGALFGFIASVLVFGLVGPLFMNELNPVFLWISGLIVGIFGQLGDLVESRYKRDAGVKDTSTLLPGHGGFLDRFDSLIFVSPFLFILFRYLSV